ncbi:MAG: hypothetical protein WCK02_18055 [Bacteroidota bacterium]
MKNNVNTYNSFVDFFNIEVNSINSLRIDGRTKGGNREVAGKFCYMGNLWKVHKDSHIEPLRKAFDAFNNNQDPFIEIPTNGHKGACLDLNSAVIAKGKFKHLYIYKTK